MGQACCQQAEDLGLAQIARHLTLQIAHQTWDTPQLFGNGQLLEQASGHFLLVVLAAVVGMERIAESGQLFDLASIELLQSAIQLDG